MADFAARITFANNKTLEFHGPADITKETTEAIVNAANSSLMGGGGVDGAIHRAGGPSILEECKRIVAKTGRLPAGKAVLTTGGRLPAKNVIHTVGPIYSGRRNDAATLASCYRESLPRRRPPYRLGRLPLCLHRSLWLPGRRSRRSRGSHHHRRSAQLHSRPARTFRALRRRHLPGLCASRGNNLP